MKLSKQERIAAIVIVAIVILAVGIFTFIKPRFETINASRASLENKQQEYQVAVEKAAKKESLRTQVMDAFDEGENLADMFFEEMTPYEAEAEFRAFLAQCDCNVIVNDVSVAEPTTTTLAPTYFEEKEVVYPLKTYATAGIEQTDEEIAAANRQQILRETLGASQQVGSITVSFDVVAIDQEEIIKFCDEVNNYMKEEAGKPTRKACMLNGIAIEYPLISNEYDDIVNELKDEAGKEGLKELYKSFNKTPPADATPQTDPNAQEEDKYSVEDYIYTISTSITFYSVARMQDPTDQLDAQDGIAF